MLLKNNVKAQWWRALLQERDDVVALDSAIIQHPRTWEASGHIAGFTDPLVDCRTCKRRYRADKLEDGQCGQKPSSAPGRGPELRPDRGAQLQPDVPDDRRPRPGRGLGRVPAPRDRPGHLPQLQALPAVLAQEAAVRDRPGRQELPQRDHARATSSSACASSSRWRWSSSCRRPRPSKWYEFWKQARYDWYLNLGIRPDHLRLRAHDADELSHYSSGTSDVEYLYPIGWQELEGIANRGNFDLTQHAEFSRQNLEYVDTANGERYLPHVIEPAAGADRATLAFLCDAYDEDEIEGETRTVLRLHPQLAPVKAAVLPLVKKDGQPELAREILRDLRERMQVEYDEGGAIGRRYRRQDEIGTPWSITVDHQSLEDRTVTSVTATASQQERVAIDELGDELERRLRAPWRSPKLDS